MDGKELVLLQPKYGCRDCYNPRLGASTKREVERKRDSYLGISHDCMTIVLVCYEGLMSGERDGSVALYIS